MDNEADIKNDSVQNEPMAEPLKDTFEAPPPVPPQKSKKWGASRWVLMPVKIGLGVLIIIVTICMYWSRMPVLFDPYERALARAIENGHVAEDFEGKLPTGYTTVSTIMALSEWTLQKPGGYLSNDRLSPALFIDNMPNFEYGMVIQLRDTVFALRHEFSRSRAQSEERQDLIEAEARYNFNHNNWLIPSTESQYREGLGFLQSYLDDIAVSGSNARLFIARQDNLEGWLRRQQNRLGSFGVRLRASAGIYEFNPYLYRSDEIFLGDMAGSFDFENQTTTHWRRRDDVFYEIRGSIYVMYHVMLAIRTDYEGVLNDYQAMGVMNRILSELHTASQPMISPVVLNGSEYGFVHNHSLTLAAHIAKAHLAVQDLRILLRGGADF